MVAAVSVMYGCNSSHHRALCSSKPSPESSACSVCTCGSSFTLTDDWKETWLEVSHVQRHFWCDASADWLELDLPNPPFLKRYFLTSPLVRSKLLHSEEVRDDKSIETPGAGMEGEARWRGDWSCHICAIIALFSLCSSTRTSLACLCKREHPEDSVSARGN